MSKAGFSCSALFWAHTVAEKLKHMPSAKLHAIPWKLGASPLGGKKNEHFRGWNGLFISRGEATGGGKLRQLLWELEMNRMGGGKDTVFGAAWRRGSGGFAGPPERHQVQPAAVVEAALRAAVAPRGRRLACVRRKGGRPSPAPGGSSPRAAG